MILILTGFALIALVDLIPIIRKRSWRGALVFFLFFIPALTLSILRENKVEVPSIMIFLGTLLKALGISY
ncbi:MAG: hypothetical protein VB106_07035 [Clostridiaceae bacterium]|jgi:uncharacterized membrane protein SirB2|nr:hypothetical protein [Clostridiaceae bacterium]